MLWYRHVAGAAVRGLRESCTTQQPERYLLAIGAGLFCVGLTFRSIDWLVAAMCRCTIRCGTFRRRPVVCRHAVADHAVAGTALRSASGHVGVSTTDRWNPLPSPRSAHTACRVGQWLPRCTGCTRTSPVGNCTRPYGDETLSDRLTGSHRISGLFGAQSRLCPTLRMGDRAIADSRASGSSRTMLTRTTIVACLRCRKASTIAPSPTARKPSGSSRTVPMAYYNRGSRLR